MTIYKYPLAGTDVQDVMMPFGAEILCVQVQYGEPCLWVKVNPEASLARKRIWIHGTGHPLSDNAQRYIGTFQLHGDQLVFHVFEGSV